MTDMESIAAVKENLMDILKEEYDEDDMDDIDDNDLNEFLKNTTIKVEEEMIKVEELIENGRKDEHQTSLVELDEVAERKSDENEKELNREVNQEYDNGKVLSGDVDILLQEKSGRNESAENNKLEFQVSRMEKVLDIEGIHTLDSEIGDAVPELRSINDRESSIGEKDSVEHAENIKGNVEKDGFSKINEQKLDLVCDKKLESTFDQLDNHSDKNLDQVGLVLSQDINVSEVFEKSVQDNNYIPIGNETGTMVNKDYNTESRPEIGLEASKESNLKTKKDFSEVVGEEIYKELESAYGDNETSVDGSAAEKITEAVIGDTEVEKSLVKECKVEERESLVKENEEEMEKPFAKECKVEVIEKSDGKSNKQDDREHFEETQQKDKCETADKESTKDTNNSNSDSESDYETVVEDVDESHGEAVDIYEGYTDEYEGYTDEYEGFTEEVSENNAVSEPRDKVKEEKLFNTDNVQNWTDGGDGTCRTNLASIYDPEDEDVMDDINDGDLDDFLKEPLETKVDMSDDYMKQLSNYEGGNLFDGGDYGDFGDLDLAGISIQSPFLVGWTIDSIGRSIVSPEGVKYYNKADAIKHLLRVGGSQDTIEAIRDLYLHQGWTRNGLPAGWLGRQDHKNYNFIAPDATAIKGSKTKAIIYLLENGGSVKEKEMIEHFSQNEVKIDSTIPTSTFNDYKFEDMDFMGDYLSNELVDGSSLAEGEAVEPLDPALQGWKVIGAKLVSPGGEIFKSKRLAIENLAVTGGNPATVEAIRNLYLAEGWTREKLPHGWLGKRDSWHHSFIAPDGKYFNGSRFKAADYAASIGSEEDKKMLETFTCPLSADIVKNIRSKISNSDRRIRLNGSQLEILKAAFSSQSHPGREQREALARRLDISEKTVYIWFQNERMKQKKMDLKMSEDPTMDFNGSSDPSFGKIPNDRLFDWETNFLGESIGKVGENVGKVGENFGKVGENFGKVGETYEDMEEDPEDYSSETIRTAPLYSVYGWTNHGAAGLASPDGLKFRRKCDAIQHMLKIGSKEIVEAIKDVMVLGGWTSKNLPPGWLGKVNDSNGCYTFITADGTKITKKAAAVQYALDNGTESEFQAISSFQPGTTARPPPKEKALAAVKTPRFTTDLPVNSLVGGTLSQNGKFKHKFEGAVLHMLRGAYDRNPYPSYSEKTQLAAKIGVDITTIQYWFQNEKRRRVKLGIDNQKPSMNFMSFSEDDYSKVPNEMTSKNNVEARHTDLAPFSDVIGQGSLNQDFFDPNIGNFSLTDGSLGNDMGYSIKTEATSQNEDLLSFNYDSFNFDNGSSVNGDFETDESFGPYGEEWNFDADKSKNIRNLSQDEICDIPGLTGWKSRGVNRLISPEGISYRSKRSAIQDLYKNGGKKETLEAIRNLYVAIGWVRENLPDGWLARRDKRSYDFISADGRLMECKQKAMEHALKHGTEADQILIRDFTCAEMKLPKDIKMEECLDRAQESSRKRHYNRIEGYPLNVLEATYQNKRGRPTIQDREELAKHLDFPVNTVTNWFQNRKKRSSGSEFNLDTNKTDPSIQILTPITFQLSFASKCQAYQAMAHSIASDQEKSDLFDSLASEGFQASGLLPKGWVFQKTRDDINFLNKSGVFFGSLSKALQYFRTNGNYSPIEIQQFHKFKSLHETNATFQPARNISEPDNLAAFTTENLTGLTSEDGGAGLSSNLTSYNSMTSLTSDDFTSLTSDDFDSTYIESQNDQNSGDASSQIRTYSSGWTSKGRGVISPSGQQYTSKRAALRDLLQNGGSKESIESIREMYVMEGWIRDRLPDGWLVKVDEKSYNFLSPDAHYMNGRQKAAKHLLRLGGSKEDYKLLVEFTDKKVDLSEGLGNLWKENPMEYSEEFKVDSVRGVRMTTTTDQVEKWVDGGDSLPSGWKIKGEGRTRRILSPDGNCFPQLSRFLQHMIENKYPLEQVEEVRSKMPEQGWRSDVLLPVDWLVKEATFMQNGNPKRSFLYCTEDGNVVSSHKGAFLYMTSREKYTQNDVDCFKLFADKNGGMRGVDNGSNGNDLAFSKPEKAYVLRPKTPTLSDKDRIRNSLRPKMKEVFAVFQDVRERMEFLRSLGWKNSQYLPENWLCKDADKSRVNLLTSTGDTLESYRAAVEHLEQNSEYTQKDVDRFLFYPDGVASAAVQRRAKFISPRVMYGAFYNSKTYGEDVGVTQVTNNLLSSVEGDLKISESDFFPSNDGIAANIEDTFKTTNHGAEVKPDINEDLYNIQDANVGEANTKDNVTLDGFANFLDEVKIEPDLEETAQNCSTTETEKTSYADFVEMENIDMDIMEFEADLTKEAVEAATTTPPIIV